MPRGAPLPQRVISANFRLHHKDDEEYWIAKRALEAKERVTNRPAYNARKKAEANERRARRARKQQQEQQALASNASSPPAARAAALLAAAKLARKAEEYTRRAALALEERAFHLASSANAPAG
jgi:hypothetical protein